MGCWSESCGVSGMEIPDNARCYMLTLVPDKYDKHTYRMGIPPVLGTYDDYGGLDLLENCPALNLKIGDNWRPEREDKFMIDAQVFDFLSTLEPDFTYGDRPKTVGEAAERWMADAHKQIKEYREADGVSKLTKSFALSDMFGSVTERPLAGIIDFESITDEFVTLYGRCLVLWRGMSELRKTLAPTCVWGPQHGGAQALIPFYEFVLKQAKARRKKYEEE